MILLSFRYAGFEIDIDQINELLNYLTMIPRNEDQQREDHEAKAQLPVHGFLTADPETFHSMDTE